MNRSTAIVLSMFVAALLIISPFSFLHSQTPTADDLQKKIADQNQKIAELQKEIAGYQAQVELTAAQEKNLQNLITTLTLTKKKLDADIALTQTQITTTNLTISELEQEIVSTEAKVADGKNTIASTVRQMNMTEEISPLEVLLTDVSIGRFWDDVQTLLQLQASVKHAIDSLQSLNDKLHNQEATLQGKKTDLVNYKQNLSGKQQAVVYTTQEQNKILTDTKNQESNYKKMIADKQKLVAAFQKELSDYESQLHFIIDPKSFPAAANGILSWPLDSIRVTQYFGNTDFAAAHAQLYNGMGHNGVDFAATIGTPIKSVSSGTVVDSGNTDTVCPGASYGKWVLVQHLNGLSSLYAHLSVISVQAGQSLKTGDVVGYSGDTGYVTGPHLHLTIYATEGVKILSRPSVACHGTYTMPIADYRAYLNPLSYLPNL